MDPTEKLTIHSNSVVGFESTWNADKDVMVRDAGQQTEKENLKKDQVNIHQTQQTTEAGNQTEVFTNKDVPYDDKKLAEFLKKIFPSLMEELDLGPTEVFGEETGGETREIKVVKHQTIDLNKICSTFEDDDFIQGGSICWLSVLSQNAPLLAISGCLNKKGLRSAWISIFEPTKNKPDLSIVYRELKTISVKNQIKVLSTNPYDRDYFAGGSTTGDIYIWKHQTHSDQDQRVLEVFSQGTEYDSVVGIIWTKQPISSSFGLISCHNDGTLLLWKYTRQNTVLDKIFKIESRTSKSDVALTCITAVENTELFVVGTLEGNLMLCSISQIIPFKGSKSVFDPVVQELQPHKFEVRSMQYAAYQQTFVVVSCDVSGEVYIHDINNPTPKIVIKLPLPFKGEIYCNATLDFILSPADSGGLEIFKVNSQSHELIENHITGERGSLIALSRNGLWLVVGSYRGIFQIFYVEH